MKTISYLFLFLITMFFVGCNQNNKDYSEVITMERAALGSDYQKDKTYDNASIAQRKFASEETAEDCDERCKTCRQQARNRYSACLSSASNETQKSQCRSNYARRLRECNN
ncbi:hypothetical protein [Aquimarina mytili]|uniref:Lipoprotein n=1 Tax=Aquimarina mytili TaxID=874423 RepID=A0A936ZWM0_9FLAO|nr:hypothetical protein [Aquimarina mytili]MBL0685642.1 hypothetical protein [Aquimarina mytili]